MANPDSTLPLPHEHSVKKLPSQGRVSHAAETKHRSRFSDIWFFSSPKNKTRITLHGQMAFFQAILFEGDLSIRGYDVDPENNCIAGSDGNSVKPAMVVFRVDGRTTWRDFTGKASDGVPKKYQKTAAVAEQMGIEYDVIRGRDFLPRLIEFDNWLMLCALINRSNSIDHLALQKSIFDRCRVVGSITLNTLLKNTDADPALIQSGVARGLHLGILEANLKTELFGLNSELRHTRSCDRTEY